MKTFLFAILCSFYTTNLFSQTIVKMEKKNGVYYVPCKVNGLPLKFIFDTGASDVIISLTEALFMLKNGYLKDSDFKETESYKLANGEIAEGTKVLIAKLEIGEKVIYNVQASVVHTSDAPLLLGQSALKGLGNVTIDYSANTLILNNKTYKYEIVNEKEKINDDSASISSSVSSPTVGEADINIENGKNKFINRDFEGSIQCYNKAIKLNPNDAIAYNLRGLSKSVLSDYKGAIKDFDISINIDSNSSHAYYNRAYTKYMLEEYYDAINDFDRAIILNSSFADAYYYRGVAKKAIHNVDGSIYDFTKTIQIKPDYPNAYKERGIVKAAIKDYEGAILDFNQAILFNSNDAYLYKYSGMTKLSIKDFKKAILDFDKAILLKKNDADFYYYRGLAKLALSDYEESIKDFDSAISLNPKEGKNYLERGFAKILSGGKYEGCLDLNKANDLKLTDAIDAIKKLCN